VLFKYENEPGKHRRYSESLWAGRPGDRILVWVRFSAKVRTGPGAHTASYSMDTGSLLPKLKRPVRGVDHPPYLGPRLKKEWSYFLLPPPNLHGLYYGEFYLYIFQMWTVPPLSADMSIIVQQDATIYSLFISVNCSICFGWYPHPSSGAHITVSTASGVSVAVLQPVVNVVGLEQCQML
jgi:hypothetical protein